MASLAMFYVFYTLLFHLQTTRGKQFCDPISCGDVDIQFPFGLKGANNEEHRSCSYSPKFQLSCNNLSQTILKLPNSGELVVNSIDYRAQTIRVNDPKGCLPNRFMHDWNLSGSPFKLNPIIYLSYYNLTFLRCPNNSTSSSAELAFGLACLRDEGRNKNSSDTDINSSSSVLVPWSRPILSARSHRCEVIGSARVPIPWAEMPMWPFWPDLNSDVRLVWNEPWCANCALSGQVCGFSNDKKKILVDQKRNKKSLQVQCFPSASSKGLSRSAKYGLTIGVGIPGLLCLIGLSTFICGKFRRNTYHQRNIDFPITISLEPMPFRTGLDGATIEKYPKTLLGESGRFLKPNDNTCAICLSEYEPKETLRSIPECNHYFHADCIDEWLKMNGTCPLCRNSPPSEASSTLTPSFSSLLSPVSSSSSPQ